MPILAISLTAPTAGDTVRIAISILPVVFFLVTLVFLDSYKLVRFKSILLTVLAGFAVALLCLWVNSFLGLKGKDQLTVMKVAKIQRWVMDQYNNEGRLTAISDQELEEQVKQHFPDLYAKGKK